MASYPPPKSKTHTHSPQQRHQHQLPLTRSSLTTFHIRAKYPHQLHLSHPLPRIALWHISMACSDHFAVLHFHTYLRVLCIILLSAKIAPRRHGRDGPLTQLRRPMPYTRKARESTSSEIPAIHTLNSMNESDVPPPLAFGTGTRNCKLSNPSASIRKDVFVEL